MTREGHNKLIEAAEAIAHAIRGEGFLSLESRIQNLDVSPLVARCLYRMVDGEDWKTVSDLLDAGFTAQRNALEKEQLLTRTALKLIHQGDHPRHVRERLRELADPLSLPSGRPLYPAAVFGIDD